MRLDASPYVQAELGAAEPSTSPIALSTVGMAVSAYHGLKRNNGSIAWGAVWAVAGRLFPVLVPVIAVAQGYGQKKVCP